MSIQLLGVGTAVKLTWPLGLGSVVLQQSLDLLNWDPVNPQPATNEIAMAITSERQFFRLARP